MPQVKLHGAPQKKSETQNQKTKWETSQKPMFIHPNGGLVFDSIVGTPYKKKTPGNGIIMKPSRDDSDY